MPTLTLIGTHTAIGFAHWASYLFDGDSSGLGDLDIELCNQWHQWQSKHAPIAMKTLNGEQNIYAGWAETAAAYTFPIYKENTKENDQAQ